MVEEELTLSRVKASMLILLGGASYGFISLFVKKAYDQGYKPSEVSGTQIFFGLIGIWLLAFFVKKDWGKITKKEIIALFTGGAFSALTGISYYLCLQEVSASFAIILLFQFTWIGMLIECIRQRRFLTRREWIAMISILIGTVFAAGLHVDELANLSLLGIIYGLISAVGYAGFILANGVIAPKVNPILRSAWMILGTAVAIWCVYPPIYIVNGTLTSGLWIWGILLGLFGTFIPSYFFAQGIPHVGSGLASILGAVELPVVIILSALFLHEFVSPLQWAGVVLIMIGIVFAELKSSNHNEHLANQ